MNRTGRIPDLLKVLKPTHLQLENESDQHSGPAGRESHFKLILVSSEFEDLSRIDRQRKVNELLKSEFESGLHALTQKLLTPTEWEKVNPSDFVSPDCGHKNRT